MTTTTLNTLTTGTWAIDPTHTEVGFVARHLMVTKVRGSFTDVTGTVQVGQDLADSVANVTIKTASVSTGTADRDTHLRSADFFDVEHLPRDHLRQHRLRRRHPHRRPDHQGRHQAGHPRRRVQRRRHRPLGQRQGRLRGHRRAQPHRLGPDLERQPREGRRPGLREDQARHRRPARQAGLNHTTAPPGRRPPHHGAGRRPSSSRRRFGTKSAKPPASAPWGGTIAQNQRGSTWCCPVTTTSSCVSGWPTRGVDASELAGILVTGDLDALLAVAGSHRRLTPLDGQCVAEARAIARENPVWPELSDLGTAACELRVSRRARAGVWRARPGRRPGKSVPGPGCHVGPRAARGARWCSRDLGPLYERMAWDRSGRTT